MLEFLPGAGWIAAGGAIAAAGPLIIHLLNRRRFKVVHWGAMHLLREAVKRNRKIFEIRDLILLALRTLAVLLIGLALAGPYFSCSSKESQPNQPVHAILVVDNGTSMGSDHGGETLLAVAKAKAKEFVDVLPPGSQVSVIPLCSPVGEYPLDPYPTHVEAKLAIDKLELVDRMGKSDILVRQALDAGKTAPDLPEKRVVFFSDMIQEKWPKGVDAKSFAKISSLQLVPVRHVDADNKQQRAPIENTWIDKFELQESFADTQSPATFVASIRHQGPGERRDVDVKLRLEFPDGTVSEQNQKVDLATNTVGREVSFTAQLPIVPQEGRPVYIGATVSLPEDALSADNHLHLSVPVLARVPVLFIDQYGNEEDPKKGKIGETWPLRRLLAPKTSRSDTTPQLITAKRLKPEEVSQEQLRDARMVIIAGIERPDQMVPDLRDYVRQGGQLVIATGGAFDPVAWNQQAWLDGDGILPVMLQATVGKTPEEAPTEVAPFTLNIGSLSKDFDLAGESREYQEQMYATMMFFKAVGADASDDAIDKLLKDERTREEKRRSDEAGLRNRITELTRKKDSAALSVEDQAELSDAQTRLANLAPHWLEFGTRPDPNEKIDDAVARTRPQVLARFSNGVPYGVERQIGQGSVLLLTSGIMSGWNTISVTNDMAMYERLLRPRLRGSLPQRTFSTDKTDTIVLPISAAERGLELKLQRPGSKSTENVGAESIGANQSGVVIRNLKNRGLYWVSAYPQGVAATAGEKSKPISVVPIAVNGPAWGEKGLEPLKTADLKARFAEAQGVSILDTDTGETVTVAAAEKWAQNLWWLLTFAVFVLLAVEMLVLAWPTLKVQGAAT